MPAGSGSVGGAFLFALLSAFALLSLAAVLIGAKVYARIDEACENNYNTRTALSYIAGKVRAFDAGEVETATFDGCPALLMYADYGGQSYATYIYVYDGQLREYFTRADAAFQPVFGEPIAAAAGFSAGIDGGLLTVRLTLVDGSDASISLYLQSGEANS